MAWSYKKDAREVDKEYQQLVDAGWTPVANPDGETYSWIKGNQVYRGKNDPTPGIDADANALDWFKRGRRQRRLMSEKVTAMLPLFRESKAGGKDGDDTPIPGAGDNTTPGDDKPKEKTAEETATELQKLKRDTVPVPRVAVPRMAPLGPDPNLSLRRSPQQPDQKKKSDKMQGREVPVWEDPDMHMSRVVYVPDDADESYAQLATQQSFVEGLGERRGIVGLLPISQSEVDWYNSRSDLAPQLVGSGMHKAGDKYYPPRITLEDGRTATLKWNPAFIPGRFNTKEEAQNYSTAGWGRDRQIAKFGDEYGVGKNAWDMVDIWGGQLNWAGDKVLSGMGLSPEAIGATASGITRAGVKGQSIIQKGKSLIQKGKQLIQRGKGATKGSGQAAKAAETVVDKPMGQLQMGGYPGTPASNTPTTTINFTPDGIQPPRQLPGSRLAPRALTETVPGSPRAITQGQVAIEGPRPMPGGPARVEGAIPMGGGPARTSTGAIPIETKPIVPRSSTRKVNRPKLKPKNASTKKKGGK